jgi:hypothetical protein
VNAATPSDPVTPRRMWRKWVGFWFAPADPTPLGFMRVVTGCICLYVHLAYAPDLQVFFGKDAWYTLATADRERREAPQTAGPLDWSDVPYTLTSADWVDPKRTAQLPETPHRKRAFVGYLQRLTANGPAGAEPGLAYPKRLLDAVDPAVFRDGIEFVANLSPNETFRRNELAKVADESLWDKAKDPIRPPRVVTDLPPAERRKVADEIEAFYRSLPQGAEKPGADEREYVLNHWVDADRSGRAALIRFAREQAGLDEAERAKRLDYLTYWNQEAQFTLRTGTSAFSLWYHLTDPTGMAVAHAVIVGVMLLFTVGFCTRVTSVLTWLGAITYIHRNQQVMFGMDTMMNILLFYLMIGPSGAALSVDRLINRYRAARAALRRGGIDPATAAYLARPPATASAGFALRLVQIHFCFIYMASGLSKLKGGSWWNTNAYWDTLVNPEFTLIHYEWYQRMVRMFVAERPLYALAAAFGVATTFIAEIGLPIIVWTRARPWIVMFGFILHAGIAVFMGLWVFSLLMMTLLLCYIPGSAFRDRLFGTTPTTGRLGLRFNPASDRQARAAALALATDFENRLDVVADDKTPADGVRVVSAGKESVGPAAAKELFAQYGWLRPVRWLTLFPGVVRAFAGTESAATRSAAPVAAGR